MDLGLQGRNAVVLASTTGLGFASARSLLEEGARVTISGRDEARLAAAREELVAAHGDAVRAERLDVTDGAALEAHLAGAAEAGGPIEILVTNAGGPPTATALEVDDAGLDASFELTLRSAIRAVNGVLPAMRERGWGRIIGMTSSSVRVPIPSLIYSNVMRSGLTSYFKSLAGEVAKEGILVNTICTGAFATDRLDQLFAAFAERNGTTSAEERAAYIAKIPRGRLGDPAEFGALVAVLASDRLDFLSGVALAYDGGQFPGLL